MSIAWQALGEANLLQDLGEGQMCSHQNATFGAQCAKPALWTPKPLRHFSRTLYKEDLSGQSMLFPFCSHFTLRTAEYFLSQYLSNL